MGVYTDPGVGSFVGREAGIQAEMAVDRIRSEALRQCPSAEILYAFFDLEICSISFDCLNWLLRAELRRQEIGCEALHVVLVPGCNEGFNEAHLEPWIKRWRLSTIFLSGCALVPAVRHVTVCCSRAEAGEIEDRSGGVSFPVGYTTRLYDSEDIYKRATDAALDAWMLGGTVGRLIGGKDMPVLEAPATASGYVRNWLSRRAQGRKVVVLTLRESDHATSRNSTADAWLRFARTLDSARYLPVIVRDTDQVYKSPQEFPDLVTCEPAALYLDVRMALYEMAYLNLLVNNGPIAICYLNPRIRYIAYRFCRSVDDEGPIPYTENYGIPHEGQIPFANEFQRIVWDDDRFDVLSATFEDMVQRIEAAEADGSLPHRLKRREVGRDEALKIAMALHRTDRLSEATRIYAYLLDRDPADSDARAMLGLLMHHRGHDEEAVHLLRRSIAQRPDVASYHFNLGGIYRRMGDLSRAEAAFRKTLEIEPDLLAAWANLAELRKLAGDVVAAERGYCRALESGAADARTIFECASTLLENGKAAAANEVFEKLASRYFRRQDRLIEEATANSPQIESFLRLTPPRYIAPGSERSSTEFEP